MYTMYINLSLDGISPQFIITETSPCKSDPKFAPKIYYKQGKPGLRIDMPNISLLVKLYVICQQVSYFYAYVTCF